MGFNANLFAARLRGKRAEADLSQDELARRAGISTRLLVDYEKGESINPSSDKVTALCRVLECDPNYLLGWEK